MIPPTTAISQTLSRTVALSLLILATKTLTTHATYDSCHTNTTATLAAPIPFSSLPSLYSHAASPQSPVEVAQILNTLSYYPLAIDSKNYDALSQVFTDDVVTNYSAPIGVLTPLTAVKQGLQAALAPFLSQHSYGTQIVELLGQCEARSVSYYTATQWGIGAEAGTVRSHRSQLHR